MTWAGDRAQQENLYVATPKYLITGALGCIGSWVLKHLTDADKQAVVLDLGSEPVRPRLVLDPSQLEKVTFIKGDILDLAGVERVIGDSGITHIIHLAALQVPFCRADPVLGAQVNVVGTVNLLEAARRSAGQVKNLVYASSVAVFGAPEDYPDGPMTHSAGLAPTTLYGVYKQANEGTGRIYWQDWQIPSIGLRPAVVYGVARDQGLTSSPTKAMLATALGLPYHVPFGGSNLMQWSSDTAKVMIQCVEAEWRGAEVFSWGGASVSVAETIRMLEEISPEMAGKLTFDDKQLPFPFEFTDAALEAAVGPLPFTPFAEGVRDTVEHFRRLAAAGLVGPGGLN